MTNEVKRETHYVAHLKIERIDKVTPVQTGGRSYDTVAVAEPKREVSEVTQMVIKAEDLERLVDKLGKHISLVEDE